MIDVRQERIIYLNLTKITHLSHQAIIFIFILLMVTIASNLIHYPLE